MNLPYVFPQTVQRVGLYPYLFYAWPGLHLNALIIRLYPSFVVSNSPDVACKLVTMGCLVSNFVLDEILLGAQLSLISSSYIS